MDGIDLSALFGPSPVFLSLDQIRGLLQLVESTEDGVAVMVLNDGGGTATARVVVGTRPIPSEANPESSTETVIGVYGGLFPVGWTEADSDEEYGAKLSAALDAGYAEGKDLAEAEQAARGLVEDDVPAVLA